MPELPEVEVVRSGLESHAVGATLTSVEVLHPRPVRSYGGGPAGFAAELTGRTLVAARRRGKYLWVALDDPDSGDALTIHLGMSGQMLVQPSEAPAARHLRVRFGLDGPAVAPETGGTAESVTASRAPHDPVSVRELRFVDQRMFGGLGISLGGAVTPPEIAHIALDPLEPAFDPERVIARMKRSASGIKRLLLTQTVISGIGNIYADEALWRAGLHGERPGSKLTKPQLARVIAAATEVMGEALAQGGTSFDALYVNVNGESGYFDRSLAAYGQEGRPCGRCGTPICRVSFMNRSSYFCPVCQPAPRRPA